MRVVDGNVRLTVKVKPRASRERVTLKDDVVVVAVNAPPVDGAANARVIELLADALAVPKRDVTVVRGETARTKEVEVRGVSLDDVVARLQ